MTTGLQIYTLIMVIITFIGIVRIGINQYRLHKSHEALADKMLHDADKMLHDYESSITRDMDNVSLIIRLTKRIEHLERLVWLCSDIQKRGGDDT